MQSEYFRIEFYVCFADSGLPGMDAEMTMLMVRSPCLPRGKKSFFKRSAFWPTQFAMKMAASASLVSRSRGSNAFLLTKNGIVARASQAFAIGEVRHPLGAMKTLEIQKGSACDSSDELDVELGEGWQGRGSTMMCWEEGPTEHHLEVTKVTCQQGGWRQERLPGRDEVMGNRFRGFGLQFYCAV